MKESLFDIVPLQKHFREIVNCNLDNLLLYNQLSSEVNRFMNYTQRDLIEIKKEIKKYTFGEDMKGAIQNRMNYLIKSYRGRFKDFVQDYEECWSTHDNFSVKLGGITLNYIKREINKDNFYKLGSELLENAIENDINLHLFTFALQPILKEHSEDKIIPSIFPFEFILSEDAIFLSNNQFSKKYTYGDLSVAEYYHRLFGIIPLPKLEKIADEGYISYRMAKKDNDFYWINRLSYWEGVEEPKRRFSVLYGIFDYFFRETLFSVAKKRNIFPDDLRGVLDIPMNKLLNNIKFSIKDGTNRT